MIRRRIRQVVEQSGPAQSDPLTGEHRMQIDHETVEAGGLVKLPDGGIDLMAEKTATQKTNNWLVPYGCQF